MMAEGPEPDLPQASCSSMMEEIPLQVIVDSKFLNSRIRHILN